MDPPVRRVYGPGRVEAVLVLGAERRVELGDAGVELLELGGLDPASGQLGGVRLEAGAQTVEVGHVVDRHVANHSPRFGLLSTSPSASSRPSASRTGVRESANSSAMRCSISRCPGR